TEPLRLLSRGALLSVADALATNRLSSPITAASLRPHVPQFEAGATADELKRLLDSGMTPAHIAYLLRLLAAEREAAQRSRDEVQLVWSGPEVASTGSRDTSVVVRELFASSRRSVLVSGYAVYQGVHVFKVLADRMVEFPNLEVRMFLDVHRRHYLDP